MKKYDEYYYKKMGSEYNPEKALKQLKKYEKKIIKIAEKIDQLQTGDIEVDLEIENIANRLDSITYKIERTMILYQDNN